MGLATLSGDNRIDALLAGSYWGSSGLGNPANLTYSIPTTNATWDSGYNGEETDTWTPLDATQAGYFRQATALWAEIANIGLNELIESGFQTGDIRVAYSQLVENSGAAGWAYVPDFGNVSSPQAGDIWLSPSLTNLAPPTFGYSTLIHELGHALGLKHPFETEDGNAAILSGNEDSTRYTIMSYTDYTGAGNIYTPTGDGRHEYYTVQPTTPMLYDILALQYLYGANTQTRTGNDTYTFSNNHGELRTIWDAGGVDTIDLSNQTLNMTLNLNDGVFSSVGVRQTSPDGSLQAAIDNIAIAFNTFIENAIGGSGNDTLIGNEWANTFTGGNGNDLIQGGSETDTAAYNGQRADYVVQQNGNQFQVSSAAEGTDTLENIELLQFQDESVGTAVLAGAEPTTAAEVDKSPVEKDVNYTNYFLLEFNGSFNVSASVDYHTADGSAKAGADYVATSGTAIIEAGETSFAIPVDIIGDNIREDAETFSLVITNPKIDGVSQPTAFPGSSAQLKATRTILDDDSSSTAHLMLTGLASISDETFLAA